MVASFGEDPRADTVADNLSRFVPHSRGPIERFWTRGVPAITVLFAALGLWTNRQAANSSRVASKSAIATARPILHIRTLKGQFNNQRASLEVELENIGRTCAVIKSMRWVAWSDGQTNCWFDFPNENNIIIPNGVIRSTFGTALRTQECNGARYDVINGHEGKSKVLIDLVYGSRELPDEEFSEETIVPIDWKRTWFGF